ncbi:YihY/virulence factor BrkB family protein [Methylibium rhizosphaerae]|uniref:YihY/virulence factor BrkB family protein n=1 Tax=Methylibium rhizosphaerae TaxID=2570323 RepID=UPI00112A0C7D|nr:YihY/virulence factor BrkB family protein [Methylibium rhizosphaerae]
MAVREAAGLKLGWRSRRAFQVGVSAVKLWIAEEGAQLGAAIAFYSMFAMAPLLVIAIALAGVIFGVEAARGQIVGEIQGLVGRDAAQGIESMIASAWRENSSGTAGLIAVGTLLVGASGVFAQLRTALNRMGRVETPASVIGAFLRARLMAFALVLGFGFLLIVSLVASAVLAAVSGYLQKLYPLLAQLIGIVDVVLSALLLSTAFAAFLRWLPDRAPRWHSVAVGAVTSALLFAVGKHLIGLYLGRVSVTSSFGAAGSFAVVMLWVYYSTQILLLGAAVAWTLEGVRPQAHAVDDTAEERGLPPTG